MLLQSMSRRTLSRIVSAAALVPLLMFAVMGTSWAGWRCGADGIVRASCCCPQPDAAEAAADETPATVSDLGCCKREQHHLDRAPSDLARVNAALMLATLSALPVSWNWRAPVVAPPSGVPVSRDERGPPPAGRWLLVQKQSFLI